MHTTKPSTQVETSHTAPAPRATSLRGIRWAVDGQLYNFRDQGHAFGVTDAEGRWLTFNGEDPYCVPLKRIAHEVATTITPADCQWMEVSA